MIATVTLNPAIDCVVKVEDVYKRQPLYVVLKTMLHRIQIILLFEKKCKG